MLAARVEPKNGPKENKKIGNFKPLVLSEFQAAVDTYDTANIFLGMIVTTNRTFPRSIQRL